ncbi:MAG: hypothetical protein M3014_03455, partial [Chloroflexota bacterium]|nr:hypothetical protein [Chloroflexota bacterium]
LLPLALLLVAAASCLLVTASYQARQGYLIDMNNSFQQLFLPSGFYDEEKNDLFRYRLTAGEGTILVEGAGRQPLRVVMKMATDGQDPHPDKKVELHSRGALLAVWDVHNHPGDFEAVVPPELVSRTTGNLEMVLSTPPFTPKGDPREIGVIMLSIKVEPAGNASLIFPPLTQLIYTVGSVICCLLCLWLLGVAPLQRLAGTFAALVMFAFVYAFARPVITFYQPGLLLASVLTLACLLLARPLVSWLYRRGGLPAFSQAGGEERRLFALFTAGLFVGFSGLLFPQSQPHDFVFHLHRLQEVQEGTIFFQNYIVAGIGQAFYPPAMYIVLLPFTVLFRSDYFVVLLAPVLFSMSQIFIVYYLCKRYVAMYSGAALLASALYVATPINLLVIWWAHEANLFGMMLLGLTLTYILTQYDRITRPLVWSGLVILCFVLMLSHPGVLIWSIGVIGGTLLAFLLLKRSTGRGSYKAVLLMSAAVICSAILAFGLYYSHYVGTFGQAGATGPGSISKLSDTLSKLGDPGAVVAAVRLVLYHGVLADYEVWPLLLVPVGLSRIFGRGRPHAKEGSLDHTSDGNSTTKQAEERTLDHTQAEAERFRWTVVVWLLVGLGLMIASVLTAAPIRPLLLVLPAVCICAGVALAAFGTRNRAQDKNGVLAGGRHWQAIAVRVMIVALAGLSLLFWLMANYLDMREPHLFPHVS